MILVILLSVVFSLLLINIKHNTVKENLGWNLILVNKNNYISDNYEVDLTELSNGQKVDLRIYPELQDMFDAARADGMHLYVAGAYSKKEKQQQLLE